MKINYIAIIWLMTFACAKAQNPCWSSQPYKLDKTLNDVFFPSATTGYIVGESGLILKTTDAGANWGIMPSPTSVSLYATFFVTTTTGWVVGGDEQIYKTTDGGGSWTLQNEDTHPVVQGPNLYDVYFINANEGWAAGFGGILLKTANGGTTWTSVNTPALDLGGVYFANSSTGIIAGLNIYKTTNGGSSWAQANFTPNMTAVRLSGATGWITANNGSVFKTNNTGGTWVEQTTSATALNDVYVSSPTSACVVGASGAILTTINGTSWTTRTSGTTENIRGVHFFGTTGWAVGAKGTILKSTNSGVTWSSTYTLTTTYRSVDFADDQTGWIVGESGVILKTTNGGSSWGLTQARNSIRLQEIDMVSSKTGWAVGDDGVVVRTINGGTSWTSQSSINTTQNLYSVAAIDSLTAYAVGAMGFVAKTTNGGTTWVAQTSGLTKELYGVYFHDDQLGWIVGNGGTILKTTNGGTTWQNKSPGLTAQNMLSLHFTDSLSGWVCGGGNILRTKDGGETWMQTFAGSNNVNIAFSDAKTGWVVGGSGTVLMSIDSGATWTGQQSLGSFIINSITFSKNKFGWIVGNFSNIYKFPVSKPDCPTLTSPAPNATEVPITAKLTWTELATGCPPSGYKVFMGTTSGGTDLANGIDVGNVTSWQPPSLPNDTQIFVTISAYNAAGDAMGCGEHSFVTEKASPPPNGCWSQQAKGQFTDNLNDVYFIDNQTGWAVGTNSTVLKTTNGGNTWTNLQIQPPPFFGILGVHFADANTGWIVGEGGKIMKTTDGGTTWSFQNSGVTFALHDVYFKNSQDGWAVGGVGTILRTTDGGANWVKQTSGTTSQFNDIFDTGSMPVWAVSTNGTILFTVTEGNTWTAQNSGTTEILTSVFFLDFQHVWVTGNNGLVLFTSNLGDTWTSIAPSNQFTFQSIFFSDTKNGWAAGSTIFKTSDGGISWQDAQSGANSINKLYFPNDSTGWAVGLNGQIYKFGQNPPNCIPLNGPIIPAPNSTNVSVNTNVTWAPSSTGCLATGYKITAGTSSGGSEIVNNFDNGSSTVWQPSSPLPYNTTIYVRIRPYNATGDANGCEEFSFKTEANPNINSNNCWTKQISGTTQPLRDVHFVDKQIGYACGIGGDFLKTSDGGKNWQKSTIALKNAQGLFFTDAQNGWVVGIGDTILKTTNGATSWTVIRSNTNGIGMTSVYFIDNQIGWGTTCDGVFRTIDGGDTWTLLNTGLSGYCLSDVQFVNNQIGYLTGIGGAPAPVFVSTDGGSNWTQTPPGNTTSALWGLHFISDTKGWAVGADGAIQHTTNGGSSWTNQFSTTQEWLQEISCIDPQIAWIAGDKGTILFTDNGGINWKPQTSNTTNNLYNIHFIDSENGWAIGDNGTILKYGSCQNSCRTTDSLELIKLYNATDGPNWTNKWDLAQPMDTWFGVTLTPQGCLQLLDLSKNNLSGTLPKVNLPTLEALFLIENKLTGSIPDFSLPNLIKLYLTNNQLSGSVSDFDLPNLQELELSLNQLTGSLPNFSKMPNLLFIGCGLNQLSGNIPNFDQLPNLHRVSLFSNQLTGSLPDFSACTALDDISLYDNQLSGSIPEYKQQTLIGIHLSKNKLTGNIPNFDLPNLRDLILAQNQLSGTVPDFKLPQLIRFYISDNKLSGLPSFTQLNSLATTQDSVTTYGNRLTFDDHLNNLSLLQNLGLHWDYTPQDSIFSDTLITRNAGEALTIDLGIDAGLTSNIYEWTKDNTVIVPPAPNTSNSNKLIFNSLTPADAGDYYVKVSNPNAPDLTLHSRRIRLVIGCTSISQNITNSICPGQSFVFNNQTLTTAGIYKDTLPGANGCDSIVTLTLSELPKPPADAGTDKRICTGSSVTLTATGGQTYRWDDNSTSASLQLTPLTSGFKYVTVTGANGCSAKDSVRVDLNPVPVVAPETDKTLCNGQMTQEILHQASIIGTVFDGTNNTPSIGLPASGNNVVKIASFTATNTGNNPVTATLTVTPKYTENGLTCAGKPDTFTITVNPSPKPQISGSLNFCAGKSTTLTATGGSTYSWAPGGTTGTDLNVNTAGVYTVTASTTLGCTASATAQVTALTPPSPSFGPSNVFAVCPGQSVTLNPGTFKQYVWSTAASTGTLTVPSTPNSYTVTVTDDNNCTAVGTAGVTELPQVGISIATPDTLTCTITQITIDGSGSSTGPFISYAWSTTNGQIISGANANKATVGKPGSYRFIVSSSLSTLCPDTTTVTIIEQKQAATDAVLDLKDPSCKGLTDGSLQVGNITSGLAPFAFSLNGGTFVNTKTFPNLAPGSYALTIRGRNGCDFVKNFSIKEGTGPQPGISDQTVCPGVLATFDGGNFAQWQWSNNSSQKTISVTQPGTYTLTVTDAKGCTGTDEAVLQNHPAIIAAATSADTLTCTKGQVTLSSAGSSTGAGITYTWTTTNGNILSGANTASPTVNKGGNYQLVVQSSQTTCSSSDTTTVTEKGKQITGIDLQTLDVKCFADSNGQIIVAAVGTGAVPFTYKLNNGAFQNGDEFDQLKPGTYALTVRGADGCEAPPVSATIKAPPKITVNIAAPTDKLSPGSSVKLPNSVTGAQGTVTYAWEGPALSCTDCSEPSVSPIFLSRYTLTITDAQGCTASAFAIVDVNSDKGQDIITPDGDGVNDELEFEEINTEPAKSMNDIIIFNRWGQPVYTAKPYANEWKGSDKSGKELPEGSYYYVLNLRDGKKEVIYGSVLILR